MLDEFRLTGKLAMVTGGAQGLGLSIAEALAEAGSRVVIIDVSDTVLQVAAALRSRGLSVSAFQCDLRDREQTHQTFKRALGGSSEALDILVNCAGIQRRYSSEHFPVEEWDAVMQVNLDATFFMCQLAADGMIPRGAGRIINVSSIMDHFGGLHIPAYAASKGGVSQLTKALSNDWSPKGIRVNAIAPGYMSTPLNTALLADEVRSAEILSRIPVGRWGQGNDLKGLAVFLASQASDYITGAVIPVDGGYSVR